MKIKDIKTFVVGNKSIHRGGPYWVFVKVTTDCGTVGYGKSTAWRSTPRR